MRNLNDLTYSELLKLRNLLSGQGEYCYIDSIVSDKLVRAGVKIKHNHNKTAMLRKFRSHRKTSEERTEYKTRR